MVAELRDTIGLSIPQFIERLDWQSRKAGASLLTKLVEYGGFWPKNATKELICITAELRGAIGAGIPQFVELLMDDYPDVQSAGVSALNKLAEYGEIWFNYIISHSFES